MKTVSEQEDAWSVVLCCLILIVRVHMYIAILTGCLSPLDQPRTLRQILHLALPDLFPLNTPPAAQVIIHGITPNLDTSALWLAQNMAYPDNFLHVVVASTLFKQKCPS